MIYHSKFGEASTLIEVGQPVLLTGEKGTGKTTLARQIADDLGYEFYSMSMTRQTTLSHLMGFLSVTGDYITSQLRRAAEGGGLMLLDEIDASDANVLLSLNTIENGYMSFPDKIINLHPDFRLIATSNPQKEHAQYTGRTKLDAATLDRFDIIEIERDANLEQSMVDEDTYRRMTVLREVLRLQNSSTVISMRDSMRYQQRKELSLVAGFVERLVDYNELALEEYEKKVGALPAQTNQSECRTLDELVDLAASVANSE